MLALDDAALAVLAIAVTRHTTAAARAALLQRFAAAADPPRRLINQRMRSRKARQRRAAGRQRWHKWAARRRAGRATCPVEYDGVALGKLILKGWLRSDTYSPEAIGRAVTDLIAHGDLPRKIT